MIVFFELAFICFLICAMSLFRFIILSHYNGYISKHDLIHFIIACIISLLIFTVLSYLLFLGYISG